MRKTSVKLTDEQMQTVMKKLRAELTSRSFRVGMEAAFKTIDAQDREAYADQNNGQYGLLRVDDFKKPGNR